MKPHPPLEVIEEGDLEQIFTYIILSKYAELEV